MVEHLPRAQAGDLLEQREHLGRGLVDGAADDAAPPRQRPQQPHELRGREGIQPARGLVQQHNGGVGDQLHADRGPLALAARHSLYQSAADGGGPARREPQATQQVVHLRGSLLPRAPGPLQRGTEQQRLLHRLRGQQRVVLHHKRHAPLQLARRDDLAPDLDGAAEAAALALGALPSGQHVQQRGLARAGGPEDRRELALLQTARDVL
mmetsp:Transcript_112785/g.319891  ORF Transcript_112785/g.319891 Transcript_112785/m.319891 type:complete len:209 (+) Transcript_112785:1120-1746(+)